MSHEEHCWSPIFHPHKRIDGPQPHWTDIGTVHKGLEVRIRAMGTEQEAKVFGPLDLLVYSS